MNTNVNLNAIAICFDPTRVTGREHKIRSLKHAINALTGQVCSNLMSHISQRKLFAVPDAVPTIDDRADMGIDDNPDTEAEHIGEVGFDTPVTPHRIARMCDAIRYDLYLHLEGLIEVDAPSSLYREPKVQSLTLVNYNQPMSVERYMDFRVNIATTVNQQQVQRMFTMRSAANANITMEVVQAAFDEEAKRNHERLKIMAPEVIIEAASLEDINDAYDFDMLPLDTQLRVALKIRDSFTNEYKRILPRFLRDPKLAADVTEIEYTVDKLTTCITHLEHTIDTGELHLSDNTPTRQVTRSTIPSVG